MIIIHLLNFVQKFSSLWLMNKIMLSENILGCNWQKSSKYKSFFIGVVPLIKVCVRVRIGMVGREEAAQAIEKSSAVIGEEVEEGIRTSCATFISILANLNTYILHKQSFCCCMPYNNKIFACVYPHKQPLN